MDLQTGHAAKMLFMLKDIENVRKSPGGTKNTGCKNVQKRLAFSGRCGTEYLACQEPSPVSKPGIFISGQYKIVQIVVVIFILTVAATTDAQERPDTKKVTAQDIELTDPIEPNEFTRAQKRTLTIRSFRRRRFPRRSKRLRRVLGKRGNRFPHTYPTIDGSFNNRAHPNWGRTNTAFKRMMPAKYADGAGDPVSADKGMPSARMVSNTCFDQVNDMPNFRNATDYLWQWGQFLDHDITLTPVSEPEERFMIKIPRGDIFFDPRHSGTKEMALERSAFRMVGDVRQQVNNITTYIDGSSVYGSDEERALALRTLDGTGRLKVSEGNLMPFNTEGLPNGDDDNDPSFFLAGDFRANEQSALIAMHTLFVREHNYWARFIGRAFRNADGERIYQLARAIVAAEMQQITYYEFLPVLLGEGALSEYRGYQPEVDPSITNEFATAAFRVGHTMLSPFLPRFDKLGRRIPEGHLLLRDAFFQPTRIIDEGGIEPILRGLASRPAQEVDMKVIDDVRNFLFGPPGAGGFDLVALNIQRSRDHGLASYNDMRGYLGIGKVRSFSQISNDPEVVHCLQSAYRSVDDIDLWVGGLSESRYGRSMLGETFHKILVDQFERLRDGDRYWFQNYLPRKLRKIIQRQTLAKIIRRNTDIGSEIPANVFLLQRGLR